MRRLLLASLIAGCSPPAPAPPPAELIPPGAVAACAGKPLQAPMVAAVASVRRIPPREALDKLAFDARVAAVAERQHLDLLPGVNLALHGELARSLLNRLRQQTSGPPTPDEIATLRRERWRDFDRPEGARVIHAVAMGAKNDGARKVAGAILSAVASASDADSFERLARSVDPAGVDVRIERLSPVARDGRLLDEEGTFDPIFAAAACDLKKPGELSPVLATPFGYHVLFLLEKTPESRPGDAELAALAGEEILARRGNAELRRLLSSLRQQNQVFISRNIDENFALLSPKRATP